MASEDEVKKCKIIIVGAGMSGLSAATHLVKNNMTDFIVLEARKRIGGRIISIEVESHRVELGANWIHGVLGNPMYEMAMSHGLIDIVNIPKPHKVVAATEDGKQVPFQLLQEIYEAYSCFLHRCEEYFLCQYEPPAGITSVGEHIALEMEMYLEGMEGEARRIRRLIFDCLLKRETCISGCTSMADIDLLELGSYTELQGGNIALPAGYSSILEPVSRHLPVDSLLLDHGVATIDWTSSTETTLSDKVTTLSDKVTTLSDNDSDDSDRTVIGESETQSVGVRVTCENGATFVADHVICTIPLGVLKDRADKLFKPPLPEYKTESIERLLFGTVDKIFLAYERPFLNPDISEIMLLWDVEEDVDKDDLSQTWYKKIYSFSKVSETLLLGWVSGREAEYMESLPQQQVADTCTCILRKFLNDPFVPKPKLCVRTKWFGEPNTRGSYTAMAVGASQADIERIARPLYAHTRSRNHHAKPLVVFAGEHTHTNFYSTVHGAFLTGRSAAQTLLSAAVAHESQTQASVDEDEPTPNVVECDAADTTDLSSWIRGIALD
ncbi:peroxisomal N(1)-acetyl-spermine/spermidine oxidase [Nilaparvata lugens]|uniref:peroxisomal N(1)-acetyl-spermine/spermidine oxidase n=1 Tax=Nilaparvata lugens TaxID=108931 RepID=UPI00193E45CD|nr:peroxisomal N(1)-acetyl-spermine/spermidine oxidase [Nilaparvata lugens]